MDEKIHHHFMKMALDQALIALDHDEVPIGCVIVSNHQVIAKGYNQTQTLRDATAHAEIIALTSAFSALNSKILSQCTLYVTVEPCAMCAGALKWAQIDQLIYGASEPKSGFSLYSPTILHPKTKIRAHIMEEDCARIIKHFFELKRNNK